MAPDRDINDEPEEEESDDAGRENHHDNNDGESEDSDEGAGLGFRIEGQGLRVNIQDPMDLDMVLVDVMNRDPRVHYPHDDVDELSSESDAEQQDEEASQPEQPHVESGQRFDHELPTRHTYLGETQQVSGRTIMEEGAIEEIPILYRSSSILMPGQTIPLIVFEDHYIALMKRLVRTTKTFGLVNKRHRFGGLDATLDLAQVGTTAEIFEFGEPGPSGGAVTGYTIKAKGRQRFKILKTRRTVDGVLMGEVKILSEKQLEEPMYNIRLSSRDRFRPFQDLEEEDSSHDAEEEAETASSLSPSTACSLTGGSRSKHQNKPEYLPRRTSYKFSKFNHLRTCVYNAPLTAQPNWVWEMYDVNILAERIHTALEKLKLFTETKVSVPKDPTELSYWVASSLPFEESHRMGLLRIDCTVSRLRLLINLIERFNILCCKNCDNVVSKQSCIFSMSKDGPQGAYVNPGGAVHETLTLYKVSNTYTEGQPQTQFSWFPGYAWEMLICGMCNSHLGWRFTADPKHSGKLHPKKFYGITIRSIKPKLEVDLDCEDDFETVTVFSN